MTVVKKPLSELRPMEKNIRRHTDKQLKEYVRSIEMFDVIKPLVVDETGLILAGNGLYYALQSMGRTECDCYVMTGLTEVQKKKVILSDNRVYELGITDTSVFEEIIRELDGDVDVPGWDEDLLEMLNASVAETNAMVESYGVYDRREIAERNRRERPEHSPELSVSEGGSSPDTFSATPLEAAENPPSGREIICPHCGGRICL